MMDSETFVLDKREVSILLYLRYETPDSETLI